jgi:thymidylate kinase
MAVQFHQALRSGYLEMAKAEPRCWVVLDGTQSVGQVQETLLDHLMQTLAVRTGTAPQLNFPLADVV